MYSSWSYTNTNTQILTMETRKYATNVVSAVSVKFLSQFGSPRIRSHCHWHRGGAFEFESILNCKCLAFEPWQSWSNRQRLFLKQVVFTEEFHWNLILPKIFVLSKIKYEKKGEILVHKNIYKTTNHSQRPGQEERSKNELFRKHYSGKIPSK